MLRRCGVRAAGTTYDQEVTSRKVTRGINFTYHKQAEKIAALQSEIRNAGFRRMSDIVNDNDAMRPAVMSATLSLPSKIKADGETISDADMALRYKEGVLPLNRISKKSQDKTVTPMAKTKKDVMEEEKASEYKLLMTWMLFCAFVGAQFLHAIAAPEQIIPLLHENDRQPAAAPAA
eukprot:TRINITY_DN37369_c0_g1_i1.p1 TRINITY_DN37369_c0_g1~~TRINITY_DN37369_c0_g1_i1.p1  ORF type:complete len:177 (+),score=49.99 TRINITY_DN37369_c0_g1_i1:64-594(+)